MAHSYVDVVVRIDDTGLLGARVNEIELPTHPLTDFGGVGSVVIELARLINTFDVSSQAPHRRRRKRAQARAQWTALAGVLLRGLLFRDEAVLEGLDWPALRRTTGIDCHPTFTGSGPAGLRDALTALRAADARIALTIAIQDGSPFVDLPWELISLAIGGRSEEPAVNRHYIFGRSAFDEPRLGRRCGPVPPAKVSHGLHPGELQTNDFEAMRKQVCSLGETLTGDGLELFDDRGGVFSTFGEPDRPALSILVSHHGEPGYSIRVPPDEKVLVPMPLDRYLRIVTPPHGAMIALACQTGGLRGASDALTCYECDIPMFVGVRTAIDPFAAFALVALLLHGTAHGSAVDDVVQLLRTQFAQLEDRGMTAMLDFHWNDIVLFRHTEYSSQDVFPPLDATTRHVLQKFASDRTNAWLEVSDSGPPTGRKRTRTALRNRSTTPPSRLLAYEKWTATTLELLKGV